MYEIDLQVWIDSLKVPIYQNNDTDYPLLHKSRSRECNLNNLNSAKTKKHFWFNYYIN